MTTRNFNNDSSNGARLTTQIAAIDVVFDVTAGLAATFPPTPFSGKLTNQYDSDDFDLVTVTDVTGDTLTVERGYGGIAAAQRFIGDRFTFEVTAEDFERAYAKVNTIFVAAHDAPDEVKRQADFVCDGVDDQVELQQAFDSTRFYPTGVIFGADIWVGAIVLSQGEFVMSGPVHYTKAGNTYINFRGAGQRATFVACEKDVSPAGALFWFTGGTLLRLEVSNMYLHFEDTDNGWGANPAALIDATHLTKIKLWDCQIEHY